MKPTEVKRALDAAIKAAEQAGAIMRQNLRSAKRVNEEHLHDIKLELDVRCQALIEELQGSQSPTRANVEYRRSTASPAESFESLRQSVQFVAGVGPRRGELLRRFAIPTVEDLLYHLPFRRKWISPLEQREPPATR